MKLKRYIHYIEWYKSESEITKIILNSHEIRNKKQQFRNF